MTCSCSTANHSFCFFLSQKYAPCILTRNHRWTCTGRQTFKHTRITSILHVYILLQLDWRVVWRNASFILKTLASADLNWFFRTFFMSRRRHCWTTSISYDWWIVGHGTLPRICNMSKLWVFNYNNMFLELPWCKSYGFLKYKSYGSCEGVLVRGAI